MNVTKPTMDVIMAMTARGGIGLKGKLPWRLPAELKLFKQKTMGKMVLVGRTTADSLPKLPGRSLAVLTRGDWTSVKSRLACQPDLIVSTWDEAESSAKHLEMPLVVAGGKQLYSHVFTHRRQSIGRLHLSIIKEDYECDCFVEFNWWDWVIEAKEDHPAFVHYVLRPIGDRTHSDEPQYLRLLQEVADHGEVRGTRNGETRSVFGRTLTFDLEKGFPLLTTKRMFTKGVVEELLFFLRGDTDTKTLEDKKVNIWRGNTTRDFLDANGFIYRRTGVMGPMYGYQWRNFNAPYHERTASAKTPGFDQLKALVDQLRGDPCSRRHLMTDYNPLQAREGVLYPCHSIILQFYVRSGTHLDMYCYNRSSDLFHGLPFNIASSALLLTLIAKVVDLAPGKMTLSLGDAHIYATHLPVVREQLKRGLFAAPTLKVIRELNSVEDLEKLERKDITVEGYRAWPRLKAAMVA